jgi:hypothetical protein
LTSDGFTAAVVILAERAGIEVDWAQFGAAPHGPLEDAQVSAVTGMSVATDGGSWAAGLREKARELSPRMPR